MKKNYKTAVQFFVLLIAFHYSFATGISRSQNSSVHGPLGFIENKGQFLDGLQQPRADLLYLFERNGMKVQLMQNRISFELYRMETDNRIDEATGTLPYDHLDSEDRPSPKEKYVSSRIDVEFIGANPHPQVVAEEVLPDYLNYYLGYTPTEGITQVRQYNKITYQNLYPNVDLVMIAMPGNDPGNSLSYDFIVHPGGDVRDIRYRYHGANNPMLLTSGKIETVTSEGKISEVIPSSFTQNSEAKMLSPVSVSFLLNKNEVSFRAANFDRSQTLVIDPELKWATYCGGDSSEEGRGLTTDSAGNVALIGRSNSTNNIATIGAYQQTLAANVDIILEKYDSLGNRVWGTYYGGSQDDHGRGLVADKFNNYYLGCHGNSPDGISTPGSYKPNYSGGNGDDGYLAYFNSAGFRVWATYYGGPDDETIRRLCIDHDGNVIMVGYTFSSTGIATPGTHQTTWAGNADLCLSKWTPDGALIWGTYFGGTQEDHGRSVAVDKNNNIYINGSTASKHDIATPGVSRDHLSDKQDYLLGKFTPDGQLVWGSYWGGALEDRGRGVFVDSSSHYVYFTGYSASDTGVATLGAYQSTWTVGYDNQGNANHDMVLMKWTLDGHIVWSSYLGGEQDDRGRAITMIGDNEIYVSGSTESTDVIATTDAFQPNFGGPNNDMFLEIWDSNGVRNYGSYFGGSGDDDNLALAIDDKHQNIFLVGTSSTPGFATAGTAQTVYGGGDDALLGKIQVHAPPAPLSSSFTYLNIPCSNGQVAFTNTSTGADTYKWTFGDGSTSTQVSPTHSYANLGTYNVKLKATNSSNGNSITATISVTVQNNPLVAVISPAGGATACKGTDITLTCTNTESGITYQWRKNGNNITGATNATYTNSKDGGNYDVVVTSPFGCTDASDATTLTFNKKPKATVTPLGDLNICNTGSVDLQANSGANFLYQWKQGNTKIPGATAQTYHATNVGDYKVNITNVNGCSKNSKAVTVFKTCKLGASSNEYNLDVYPNPAISTATISFSLDQAATIRIELTDVEGRKLQTIFSGKVEAGNQLYVFDRGGLSDGVYFIKLISTTGTETRKLVIQ